MENSGLQKRISQLDQERLKQVEVISELSHLSEKARDASVKYKKKYEALFRAIQLAKEIMAGVLTVNNSILLSCKFFYFEVFKVLIYFPHRLIIKIQPLSWNK